MIERFSHMACFPLAPSQHGQVYEPHGPQPVVQEPQERYQEGPPRQGPAAVLQGGALTPRRALLPCACSRTALSPARAACFAAVLALARARPLSPALRAPL